LFRHSSWNAIATFGYQGSTFFATFLVIKILEQESYGKFSLVSLTALHAANILQFAVGSTIAKFCSRYLTANPELVPAAISTCAVFSVLSGAIGCAMLVLGSGLIADGAFADATLSTYIAIAGLSIPGLILTIFITGLLQGLMNFRYLAIAAVVSGFLFILVVAYGASAAGLLGATIGFVIGSSVRCLILAVAAVSALNKQESVRVSRANLLNKSVLREIVHFQFPAGLAGFLTIPTLWLMPAILARTTQDYSEVALYSVIILLKSLVVLPASVICLALQPSAERAWVASERDVASRVFSTGTVASLSIVGTLALLLALFAKPVLELLGPGFARASFGLQLIMVVALAEAAALAIYMRVQARNRMWASIFATLVPRDLIMLVIAFGFTSTYGLKAVVLAHVIGAIANLAGVYALGFHTATPKYRHSTRT
jgi:O-antigen/teichoic acid export membrane protein